MKKAIDEIPEKTKVEKEKNEINNIKSHIKMHEQKNQEVCS
jgi:hypothetical protein